jgi:hypothetical protein
MQKALACLRKIHKQTRAFEKAVPPCFGFKKTHLAACQIKTLIECSGFRHTL